MATTARSLDSSSTRTGQLWPLAVERPGSKRARTCFMCAFAKSRVPSQNAQGYQRCGGSPTSSIRCAALLAFSRRIDVSEIPRAILSEHFQERMKGRRVRSAVFLTFQFDPGFFEQEVLPVLIDASLSHAAVIRLVHLEDVLRTLPGQIAVYYDANGLVSGDAGSAKLDIRRIPVQHRTGIFHPKNVFLLAEAEATDNGGNRPQTLIVASLSANLTRMVGKCRSLPPRGDCGRRQDEAQAGSSVVLGVSSSP